MPDRERHRVVGMLFSIWAILLFWMISEQVHVPKAVDSQFLNPRFWPFTLACLTALVSLYLIWLSFVLPETRDSITRERQSNISLYLVIITLVPIPFLLQHVGFIAVLALTALVLNYLRERKWSLRLLLWITALSYGVAEFFSSFLGVLAEKWPS